MWSWKVYIAIKTSFSLALTSEDLLQQCLFPTWKNNVTKDFSFLLAEIPYRKFMFFYALRNEFLRLGTEFPRFFEKMGKFSS